MIDKNVTKFINIDIEYLKNRGDIKVDVDSFDIVVESLNMAFFGNISKDNNDLGLPIYDEDIRTPNDDHDL
ncbi:hypothetical protein AHAS_Ahas15G0197100 [Arachis hypogaea]